MSLMYLIQIFCLSLHVFPSKLYLTFLYFVHVYARDGLIDVPPFLKVLVHSFSTILLRQHFMVQRLG